MKNYQKGILLGLFAIISCLVFVGIPFGTNILEIISECVYILGLVGILYLGLFKKSDKALLIYTPIYLLITFILVFLVESTYKNYTLVVLGFLPSLIISIVGIKRSIDNKENYKTTISLIVNIIALILSIISMLAIIPNGGFIIK